MEPITLFVEDIGTKRTYTLSGKSYQDLRSVSQATPTKGSITIDTSLCDDYGSVYGPPEWNIVHLLTGLPIDDLVDNVFLNINGIWLPLLEQEIVHISGHLDLTEAEFDEHYVPAITEAFARKAAFVVGDARGADTMAQHYLAKIGAYVTVYHMFDEPRVNVSGYPAIGGFTSDTDRDTAMTHDSDTDIAWVRPGREKSGTAKNLSRRMSLTSGKRSAG